MQEHRLGEPRAAFYRITNGGEFVTFLQLLHLLQDWQSTSNDDKGTGATFQLRRLLSAAYMQCLNDATYTARADQISWAQVHLYSVLCVLST
jgi:hypothetical protein